MFGGYYGRRRLKRILIVFVGLLVWYIFFYPSHEPIWSRNEKHFKAPAPFKTKSGIISMFEFRNSPYLTLSSMTTNWLPIIILSKAKNIEVRDAIRRTWGFNRSYRNETLRVKILFLVGTDDVMTQRIYTEQNVFDDVVQVNIPEMYSFSAYKELSAMIWVRSYMPDVPFYIKTEDQIILNMKVLVDRLLPIVESVSTQELIIGWFDIRHSVKRNAYQKFVDAVMTELNSDINYAMNLFYVVTKAAASSMIRTLNRIEHIDYPGDPFVTGILRDSANVQYTNLAVSAESLTYVLGNGTCRVAFTNDKNLFLCASALHIGPMRSMNEYFESWNVLIGQLPL